MTARRTFSIVGKSMRALARLRRFADHRRARIPFGFFLKAYRRALARRLEAEWTGGYLLRDDGSYVYFPAKLDEHARSRLANPTREGHIATRFCRLGGVAFDIGANIGDWTVPMAIGVGPGGRVFAFEPIPEVAESLRRTIKVNGWVQAEVIESALGDSSGRANFVVREDHTAMSGFDGPVVKGGREKTIAVEKTTLDAFVIERNLGRIDFIKIDVEGHEAAVLRGGRGSLRRFRPALVIEAGLEDAGRRNEIAGLLRGLGYAVVGIVVEYGIVPCDWDAYVGSTPPFEAGRHVNVLFVP